MAVQALSQYNKNNPFLARVTENTLLNQPGTSKETRHFVVDLREVTLVIPAVIRSGYIRLTGLRKLMRCWSRLELKETNECSSQEL
jgi:hypothetical protein